MLGWEFPPHISGGLGTACQGIVEGLADAGVDVVFVLPHARGDEEAGEARVLSASAARPPAEFPPVASRPIDSALAPYVEPASYLTRVARLAPARPAPPTTYGPDLFAEVQRYAEAARTLAASESFDVVHGHDWMTFPAAAAVSRDADVPLVLHVHSCEFDRSGALPDPRIQRIEQEGIDAADAVVCVSHYAARILAAHYRVDPAKLHVVHNALRPRATALARSAPRHVDEPVVLFLGRLTHQKGPGYFLMAAARVARVEKRVKFVMAGSGDLLGGLVEAAASLGLARHVHFTGFLRGEDVARMFRHADVYVMPSVSEPFGISPLEAAEMGVPVIVSRQSGVAEVLPSALRADYWDVDDLAEKILALLRRPALRATLVTAAREEARRLDWRRQARRLLDVYEEVRA